MFLAACVSPERGAVLLDVPFLEQPPDRCGPASVAMVAKYHGIELDQDALERDVFIPALAGSIPALLAEGARRQGLAAEVRLAQEPEIQAWLSNGWPLILLLAPVGADPRGHFIVVTGFNPRTGALRVHSGSRQNKWTAARRWRQRWLDAGSQVVLIRPRLDPNAAP